MNSAFFNRSKDVADEFIQNIVFLDDRIYKRGGDQQNKVHDLDPFEITKAFAERAKICALYNPQNIEDVNQFKSIANKADIVILDWFIDIQEELVEEEDESSDEQDAADQAVRGTHTKNILNSIVKNNIDGLKVILVYTGETDLQDITQNIHKEITGSTIIEDRCEIRYKNLKILVRAKSNDQEGEDVRFNHITILRDKVLKYSQLPEFLLNEFTMLTEGLLSNFALKSLSTLRSHTSKILGLYTKELDHAFLEHKSSIPNYEDADQLMIEVLKDSIGDLLHYKKAHGQLSKKHIENWLTDRIQTFDLVVKQKNGSPINDTPNIPRNKKLLAQLLFNNNSDVKKKYIEILSTIISKAKAEKYVEYLQLNNIDLFINPAQEIEKANIIKSFAKLTHHKSVFLPRGTRPVLTLGTVLKGIRTNKYIICIQQRCDSVRIGSDEQRKFLFLPLDVSENGKFNFVTPDNIQLKLSTKSYHIRTIKFASNGDGIVQGTTLNGKFIFKQIYNKRSDEKFEWVLDLKDLHSQRIVADYASLLSRVGLDESEWLRKSLLP